MFCHLSPGFEWIFCPILIHCCVLQQINTLHWRAHQHCVITLKNPHIMTPSYKKTVVNSWYLLDFNISCPMLLRIDKYTNAERLLNALCWTVDILVFTGSRETKAIWGIRFQGARHSGRSVSLTYLCVVTVPTLQGKLHVQFTSITCEV